MDKVLSINEYLLNQMKTINPNLEDIQYDPISNICSFDKRNINLNGFSLLEIYNKYSQLSEDIEIINPEDLFNIFRINVAVYSKINEPETPIKDNIQISNNGTFNLDIEEETDNIDTSNLIDLSEYESIINNSDYINEEESNKIKTYEDFMKNLYKYKSYLNEDGLNMWQQYEKYIIIANTFENNNDNTLKAIDTYNEITSDSNQLELENANKKVLALKKQEELAIKQAAKENRAGIANALLIVEITTFVSITLAAILFVLLKK